MGREGLTKPMAYVAWKDDIELLGSQQHGVRRDTLVQGVVHQQWWGKLAQQRAARGTLSVHGPVGGTPGVGRLKGIIGLQEVP